MLDMHNIMWRMCAAHALPPHDRSQKRALSRDHNTSASQLVARRSSASRGTERSADGGVCPAFSGNSSSSSRGGACAEMVCARVGTSSSAGVRVSCDARCATRGALWAATSGPVAAHSRRAVRHSPLSLHTRGYNANTPRAQRYRNIRSTTYTIEGLERAAAP
jgi:hypothetical protein